MLIFYCVEKIAKRLSYQRTIDRKMEYLTFITAYTVLCPKVFGLLVDDFFAFFPSNSNPASSFAFYDNHIKFRIKL